MRREIEQNSFPGTSRVGADDLQFAHEPLDGFVGESVCVDGGAIRVHAFPTALRAQNGAGVTWGMGRGGESII